MRTLARKHPLVVYVVVTYIFSWSIFIPLALKKHGIIELPVPFPVYYFASLGPLLSALVTSYLVGGSESLKELIGRMFRWRVHWVWWLVAFSPLLLFAVTAAIIRLATGERFDPALLGQVEFLPDLGFGALLLWLLTYGIGEETGWRGFALPRLQKDHSALRASFYLWIIWACWHAPAFFLVYDPAILPGFLVGVFAGAIVFTWLYNSSKGSILIVAVWHGVFNFTTASKASKAGIVAAVISTIIMIWAVLVVVLYKPANLSRSKKQVTA
jgi:membrane protease YdiL (CAAX protease family)